MTDHPHKVYLSLIIPSYKSASILEHSLPPLLTWLKEKKIAFEVIIVDDGSNDQGATEKLAQKLDLVFTANPVNKGKGAAVKRGVQAASGRFIIYTDADIPFEYQSIDDALRYLDQDGFDVVIGDRYLVDSAYFDEISLKRKISSYLFTGIVNGLIAVNFRDTQCGFKGFRSEVAKSLFSAMHINGFAFDVEMLHIAAVRKHNIKPMPISLRVNADFSTVKILPQAFTMFRDLLRIKYHQMNRHYVR
jgi:dolichyl-phosphate beta-glucosyltransferase